MHWIDILFIAIIIIFAFIGIYKGLFDSILDIIGSGISILLAIWACKPVAKFLNSLVNVDGFFTKIVQDHMGETIEIFKKQLTATQVGSLCTIVISILAVWLLIKLAIKLLEKLFDDITTSSVAASGLNRVFGMFFGAAKGLLVIAVFLGVIGILKDIPVIGAPINDAINQTKITRSVSNYVDEFVERKLSDALLDIVENLTKPEEKPEEKPETPTNPDENPAPVAVIRNVGINKDFKVNISFDKNILNNCVLSVA